MAENAPKATRRYVELAVCEDCGRVFHQASMRGRLCVSCASRRAVPDPSKPPVGFVEAVCHDCGKPFTKPSSATRAIYCWKCADRRAKKADRLRKKRLAERPVVFEDAVCPECGKTFQRPSSEDNPGRPRKYCRECARNLELMRYRRYKARRAAAN